MREWGLKKKILRAANGVGIQDAPGKMRELTDYLLLDKPRNYIIDVPGMTPPHFLFDSRPNAWTGLELPISWRFPKIIRRMSNVRHCFVSTFCTP
jgi:hypothetical protein